MRRIPLSIEVKKVLRLLMYTLLGMLIFVSIYFFAKTTSTAERGYSLKESQLQKNTLESENRILKQRVLDTQSLNEVKNSSAVEGMTEPAQTIFIKPKGPLTQRRPTI